MLSNALCFSFGSISIPAEADAGAASRADEAAATEELSAKLGREGPKQAERSRAPWKSPLKDVVWMGAPARGIFSAHRRKRSLLQQRTPQPVMADAVHSHHPAATPVAAAPALRPESGLMQCVCGWRYKAIRKVGSE